MIEFSPGPTHINPVDFSNFPGAPADVKNENAREEGLNDLRTQHWTDDSGAGVGSECRPHTGKLILKTGKRPGIPFKAVQVKAELEVTDTNQAWKRAAASNGTSLEQPIQY